MLFGAPQDATVRWTFGSAKTGDSEYELSFKADIAQNYYVYGMEKTEGPLPLEFSFEGTGYELSGEPEADKKTGEKFDEGFSINVKYYSGSVTFKQKVKLAAETATVKGTISYQSCSAEQCIPGSADFSFDLKGGKPAAIPATAATDKAPSFAGFFVLAFLMGLLGVLTPCVFPMIPMTVSFFMSGSDRKTVIVTKSLIFEFSVTLIYTLVGLIVALTQNPALASVLSTHWIPNLMFFALFVVFALWFFGLFEITLPSSLANKADRRVDKGGYLASFFLAITLAVVSFSCTGPFVGTLLVESTRDGFALKPILGMFGFGLGLGSPFVVFSFMPSLMKKLPKSGGWLNSVKVVFAFVISALSVKFLDIADNSLGLGLVTRDAVIALWMSLAILLGLYLLGKLQLAHDSSLKHVSVFRLVLAVASFAFAFYLLPGLFGAPLSSVSAFLPAQEKQVFDLTSPNASGSFHSARQQTAAATSMNTDILCGVPKYSDFLTLPKGISGYFDLKEGLACAKAKNKPVLLDFKGHSCSNCKKMEKSVFIDKRVISILNEKFIVIGLYTDDKTVLPESEHVKTDKGKILKTVGEINLHYQAETFGLSAQPYFVITDADGVPKSKGLGYVSDPDKFLEWVMQ
jgi:thiol:disulfide interchange protein DsbD